MSVSVFTDAALLARERVIVTARSEEAAVDEVDALIRCFVSISVVVVVAAVSVLV